MSQDWYPKKIRVSEEGTPSTYNFMSETFSRNQHFNYAEFGFHNADTARNICERFPNATLFLFDFEEKCVAAKEKLEVFPNRIHYFGNTQKFNDSYNWSLMKLLTENNHQRLFDYCFLDGAHTFAVDALTFFLCDKMVKAGGYLDFDDYHWRLRGSSLDPENIPVIADQYTDEQIDDKQVARIVDGLVRPDPSYEEIVQNKVFLKSIV